jgi:hypothetical protein
LRSLEEHKGYTEICHPTCFRILLRMMTSYWTWLVMKTGSTILTLNKVTENGMTLCCIHRRRPELYFQLENSFLDTNVP